MAFLQNQGARIYWDEQGSGDPILLIMGLGYPSYLWHRTRPALKERYRTIALDNRGSGQSDAPTGPYSIALMASDAAAALDAAGIKAVVAEFYARIFFRNSVNGGYLVPFECVDRLFRCVVISQ